MKGLALIAPLPAGIPAIVLFLAVAACSSPSPEPAPAQPAAARTAVLSGTVLFCGEGAIGMRPDPLPPGYDAYYVVAVIDIDNPGGALANVRLSALDLLNDKGAPEARMRELQELGAFPPDVTLPALDTNGSAVIYFDSKIPGFDGTLAPGDNRLRVRAWIDASAHNASRVRIRLGNAAQSVVVDGPITGRFPS